jgi:F-type H+-transporting ATPase subunit gamma
MIQTTASLQRKIKSAGDLKSVVSSMKAIATISISQYQDSVQAQHDYYEAVQLGLLTCLQQTELTLHYESPVGGEGAVAAVVFGSDQGLVGQFNETLVDYVVQKFTELPGPKSVWAVGERMQARLEENELQLQGSFPLPNAIGAVTPLVTSILSMLQTKYEAGLISEVYLFHNRPTDNGIFEQTTLRRLPLDARWRTDSLRQSWPGANLPEVLGDTGRTLLDFVHEYLFVALFRACAESLASENASRLSAMHRAEKNIGELLDTMHQQFHQLRQSSIDEELFDQVSGAEALAEDRGSSS